MNFFPTIHRTFILCDDYNTTITRLKRRTEYSEYLTSSHTDKSFRGVIENNSFKIISSKIGRGAFCVMKGSINEDQGEVNLEIHRVFKILISIVLALLVIGNIVASFIMPDKFSVFNILMALLMVVFIRFFFVGFAFHFLSKSSLERLKDVLDIEYS